MAAQVSHPQSTSPNADRRRTNKPRSRGQRKYGGRAPVAPETNGEVPNDDQDAKNEVDVSTTTSNEGARDTDICWICAEPVEFYSLSECNHRTCHVCALRLRALYKKTDCTFCKHPQSLVIFTASPSSQFETYNTDGMPFKDSKLSIVFETQEMMEESLILLRFNCPDSDCPYVARGWNDLKVHVRAVHGTLLCDLCIRMKKVFSHEHTLYTSAHLQAHLPSMRRGRALDKTREDPEGGIHPLCEFCKECYFGDDELFLHMRERHEECFICKRQGIRDQYFLDYPNLELHFNNAHHPCTQPVCREQKFVVFGSLMDLKAHMVEVHGAAMSAKDMKEARRVETSFEFDHNRGANARRRERDRDWADVRAPARTPAQQQYRPPDRRREGLNAALTEQDASGSNTPASQQNGRSSPLLSGNVVDPESARRHAAFMGRVASLTANSSTAETSVRSAIKSFHASESTAKDLISTFYNVVDRDLEATASLIVPLVDLLDDEGKKNELLESFNGFKIEQRQQFPDLTPSGRGSAYAGVASGRVLNVKHSTQSRRNVGQVWDRVARAATSSVTGPSPSIRQSERFPSLPNAPPAVPTAVVPSARRTQRSTPWITSSTTTTAAAARSNVPGGRSTTSGHPPALSASAFPSLPAASPRPKLPVGGNKSLRNIAGGVAPSASAWGAPRDNPEEVPTSLDNAEEADPDAPQQKKGKKKGKEKVTLFTLGTFPT